MMWRHESLIYKLSNRISNCCNATLCVPYACYVMLFIVCYVHTVSVFTYWFVCLYKNSGIFVQTKMVIFICVKPSLRETYNVSLLLRLFYAEHLLLVVPLIYRILYEFYLLCYSCFCFHTLYLFRVLIIIIGQYLQARVGRRAHILIARFITPWNYNHYLLIYNSLRFQGIAFIHSYQFTVQYLVSRRVCFSIRWN